MVINVQFHLFQEAINQFTVVIALDKTNLVLMTTEVQDIQETTDHQETTEVQEIKEIILDLGEKVIKF